MTFDWREYQLLAKDLVHGTSEAGSEAKLRSAVSRAYYAVFCKSLEILNRKGVILERTRTHSAAANHLALGSPAEKRIAERLRALRGLRLIADYDGSDASNRLSARHVASIVEQAGRTILNIEQQLGAA